MHKKETVRLVYLLAFTFLALSVFGGLGFYDNYNAITGATTYSYFGNLGSLMEEALRLPFESVIAPFFTTVFGPDYYIYSIKILLIIVLSIIFNLGTILLFKENKKSARWIAIIFATLGVVLIPSEFLSLLFGGQGGDMGVIGMFIVSAIILAFLLGIFIPLFKWGAKGIGNNILRGLSFIVLIFLVSWVRSFSEMPGFLAITLDLITLVCLIMFIISFIRAFSGTGRDAVSAGGRGLNSLRETGGLRTQPGRIRNWVKDIWGKKLEKDEIPSGTFKSDDTNNQTRDNLKKIIISNYNVIRANYGYIMENSNNIRNFKKIVKYLEKIRDYSAGINSSIGFSNLYKTDGNINLIYTLFSKIEKDSKALIEGFNAVRETISFKALLARLESSIGKTIRDLQSPINKL